MSDICKVDHGKMTGTYCLACRKTTVASKDFGETPEECGLSKDMHTNILGVIEQYQGVCQKCKGADELLGDISRELEEGDDPAVIVQRIENVITNRCTPKAALTPATPSSSENDPVVAARRSKNSD